MTWDLDLRTAPVDLFEKWKFYEDAARQFGTYRLDLKATLERHKYKAIIFKDCNCVEPGACLVTQRLIKATAKSALMVTVKLLERAEKIKEEMRKQFFNSLSENIHEIRKKAAALFTQVQEYLTE